MFKMVAWQNKRMDLTRWPVTQFALEDLGKLRASPLAGHAIVMLTRWCAFCFINKELGAIFFWAGITMFARLPGAQNSYLAILKQSLLWMTRINDNYSSRI